jgi:hypothetical protein
LKGNERRASVGSSVSFSSNDGAVNSLLASGNVTALLALSREQPEATDTDAAAVVEAPKRHDSDEESMDEEYDGEIGFVAAENTEDPFFSAAGADSSFVEGLTLFLCSNFY